MYAIIKCYNCGRLLLAKKNQKTRQCPHCEFRLIMEKARIFAFAETPREASRLIQQFKRAETKHVKTP